MILDGDNVEGENTKDVETEGEVESEPETTEDTPTNDTVAE